MNAKQINDKNLAKIMKIYKEAYGDVEGKLIFALDFTNNPYFKTISVRALYQYVELRFAQLERELKLVVPQSIHTTIAVSYALSLRAMHRHKGISHSFEEDLLEAISATNNTITINRGSKAYEDVVKAIHSTEYTVKALIQRTNSQHLVIQSLQNTGRDNLVPQAVKAVSGKAVERSVYSGMTAIVDKAGRRWNTEVYVDMAMTTEFHQAYMVGMEEYNDINPDETCDLALIPVCDGTIDSCTEFEGLVISLTGDTEGYPTYDEIEATGMIFHPNCRHDPIPYYSELDIPSGVMGDQDSLNRSISRLV